MRRNLSTCSFCSSVHNVPLISRTSPQSRLPTIPAFATSLVFDPIADSAAIIADSAAIIADLSAIIADLSVRVADSAVIFADLSATIADFSP